MEELNNDIATRDKIIFGRYRANRYKFGNLASFEKVGVDVLDKLIELNYLDKEASCGDIQVDDVVRFMHKYPIYKAHGTVSGDGTVTIEGVEKGQTNDTVDEFQDYMRLFRNTVHFDSSTMYCSFR